MNANRFRDDSTQYRAYRRGLRGKVVGCLLLGVALARPGIVVGATTDSIDDVNQVRQVQIDLVAQVAAQRDLDALLVEWFGADSERLKIRHVPTLLRDTVLAPATDPNLLRIWVVLASPNVARVYFAEASGRRFLMREVPLRDGLDEFGRENLVQVIVTSAHAFIEQDVSSPVADVEAALKSPLPAKTNEGTSADPARPTAPTDNPWFFRAGVFYAIDEERAGMWDHGPGALLGIGRRMSATRFSLNLGAQYHWQRRVTEPDIELLVNRFTLRSTLVFERNLSPTWSLGVEGGGAVTRESFQPRATASDIDATSGGAHIRPFMLLGPRTAWAMGDVRCALFGGVSIYFSRTHFDVVRNGLAQERFAPWTLQPSVAFEAAWK